MVCRASRLGKGTRKFVCYKITGTDVPFNNTITTNPAYKSRHLNCILNNKIHKQVLEGRCTITIKTYMEDKI